MAMDDRSPPELDDLSEDLIHLIKPELQPGERLLWAATSRPRLREAGRAPWPSTFLSLALFGVSLAFFHVIFGPTRDTFLFAEHFLILAGLVSAIISIVAGNIALVFWCQWWQSRRQMAANTYALTDRRAILWLPRLDSDAIEIHSVSRGEVRAIHRLEHPDGSGDVKFNFPNEQYYRPSGLDGVADVHFVEDLARRALLDPRPYTSV